MPIQCHPAALPPGGKSAGAELLDGVDELLIDPGNESDSAAGNPRHTIRRPHAGTLEENTEVSIQRITPCNNGTKRTRSSRRTSYWLPVRRTRVSHCAPCAPASGKIITPPSPSCESSPSGSSLEIGRASCREGGL